MQEEKEDGCLHSGAHQSARSQIRPEQRTIRDFCVDKNAWVTLALERVSPPLKSRMQLRKPIFHERLDAGSQSPTLIKVGVNIVQSTVRTQIMAAISTVTG